MYDNWSDYDFDMILSLLRIHNAIRWYFIGGV